MTGGASNETMFNRMGYAKLSVEITIRTMKVCKMEIKFASFCRIDAIGWKSQTFQSPFNSNRLDFFEWKIPHFISEVNSELIR